VRISPHTAEVARQLELVQDAMKRYRHTLRELAKGAEWLRVHSRPV